MPTSNKSLKSIAAWHKKKRQLILACLLFMTISLLFSFFFGEMGFIHFSKMKRALHQSETEIHAIERENDRLIQEIEALKTDASYIEKIARDRLGLIKKGETTYEFYNRQN